MNLADTYAVQTRRTEAALHAFDWSVKAAEENVSDLVRFTAELMTSRNFRFSPEEAKAFCERLRGMIASLRKTESNIKQS